MDNDSSECVDLVEIQGLLDAGEWEAPAIDADLWLAVDVCERDGGLS